MLDKIKEYLTHFNFLSPLDIINIVAITKIKTIKKGECVVREGEYNYNIIVVLKGLLKCYIINEHGEEHTMLFVPERKNAASSQTLLRNKPAAENIVALENSLVALSDIRKFDKLAKNNPSLLLLQNKLLKEVMAFTVDQNWSIALHSSEQRYLKFCKEFPKLEQRITQKDLASYLGITPTSLSRIRARITKP